MFSFQSAWAITLRYLRLWKNDPNVPLFNMYWPILDILTWGFLGTWIQGLQSTTSNNVTVIIVTGLLLFQVCSRGCNGLCIALIEEMWSDNVVNLFSLPISMTEWICGTIMLAAINMCLVTTACMGLTFLLYSIPVWQTITTFLWFAPPLFLACLWLGFTSLAIIITLGKRGVEMGFVFAWFFLPFCGAYFPVEVLPAWGQTISAFLPMSSVFAGLRAYLGHNQDPTPFLLKGYAMGALYALAGIALFVYAFSRSKKLGLARLAE